MKKMDSLERAAQRDRVQNLFNAHAAKDVREFKAYAEVMDMLWEEEFRDTVMRILELAGKIPYRSVRISFLQGIILGLLQPLCNFDANAMLHMVLEELNKRRPPVIMAIPFNPQVPEDEALRPGVF